LVIKRSIFETEEDNKPKVDLKYPAHYTLSWIACINNKYKVHKALKVRNYKYLVRMYWILSELKYRNVKFIYG